MKKGSTLYYLHHDQLGSLVSATDASGNEIGSTRYWPFSARGETMHLSVPVLLVSLATLGIGVFLIVLAQDIQSRALARVPPEWARDISEFAAEHLTRSPAYPISLRVVGMGGVILGLVIIYLAFQPLIPR